MRSRGITRTVVWVLVGAASVWVAGRACGDGGSVVAEWQVGEGLRGVDGTVNAAILWDRDGAGGEPPSLVIGGSFTIAGTTAAASIARWDGTTWEPLGSGVSGEVSALAVLPDRSLIAGGGFLSAGGVLVNKVARWNGASWEPLGSGIGPATSTAVRTLAVMPDGSLVAAGRFATAGGVAASNIARWNGAAWTAFGGGIGPANALVNRLVPTNGGGLIACGSMTSAGGVLVNNIAQWNGSAWEPLGSGLTNTVYDALPLGGGEVLAVGGNQRAHRWNGSSWVVMNQGALASGTAPESLGRMSDGTVVAGGSSRMVYWTGSQWSTLGGGIPGRVAVLLTLDDGSLLAGGSFLTAGSVHASSVARFAGGRWQFLGSGVGGVQRTIIHALLRGPGHEVIAGGSFTAAGNVEAAKVARWDGQHWWPLGDGFADGDVHSLARLPNGSIVAGGSFRSAEGMEARGVARWDGARWLPVGTGAGPASHIVQSLAVTATGDLIAGGAFQSLGGGTGTNLARWNGESWVSIGGAAPSTVLAVAVLDTGDIVVGGEFAAIAGVSANRIARWDGTTWNAMGTGMNGGVHALHPLPGGRLLAAGRFGTAGGAVTSRVALWNGETWTAMGPGMSPVSPTPSVHALTVLANGDVIAGGNFRLSPSNAENLARWDGTAWHPVGTGASGAFDSHVYALAPMPDGGFVAAGGFSLMDGRVSARFARWGLPIVPEVPLPLGAVERGPDGMRLHFSPRPNRRYTLQYSPDMRQWSTVIEGAAATGGSLLDADPQRQSLPHGWYRVLEFSIDSP